MKFKKYIGIGIYVFDIDLGKHVGNGVELIFKNDTDITDDDNFKADADVTASAKTTAPVKVVILSGK